MRRLDLLAFVAALFVLCTQSFAVPSHHGAVTIEEAATSPGVADAQTLCVPFLVSVVDVSPRGTSVSTGVSRISVAFSVAMNKSTAQAAFSVSPQVPGRFVWVGNTMRYQLTSALAEDTTYAVTVAASARSAVGAFLLARRSWRFTTSAPVQAASVACCGDSITAGLYPDYLQDLIGASGEVNRFGDPGTSVIIGPGRPYIDTAECDQAQASGADVVVIMLGTNDSAPAVYRYIGDFVADYERLVGQFQALPRAPQIWLALPPRIFATSSGLSNANLVQGVIPRISQVASAMGVRTIDVYSATSGHPEYFADGVHPNSRGAAVVADVIYQAIR